MAEVFTKTEDLWNPYKDLQDIVFKHLTENITNLCNSELESVLRKHKQSFFSLLQNPPKNAKSREEIKKGMTEGITVRGLGHQILSNELYQETIILSDMFDINEFVALDLLCTAQLQVTYHPGLPRGLVAVLLYYDGRKALLSSLRCLVQARNGVQWSVNIKEEVARFITIYTDQLMEGGLFNRIFELLRQLDLSKELEKLHQNVALGGPKHRKQVKELFLDIRNLLGDIVFIWSTQSGLPKAPTLSLINYLREVKAEEEASGKLDSVNLTLQMALLCALDLSILHTREDGEEIVKSLPILSHKNYLEYVVKEFGPNKPKWNCEGLEALSTFGVAVCIASLRLVSQNHQFQEFIGKEELFIDKATDLNVFDFLHNIILDCKLLYQEEFMYKRMHYLLTDFIVYLYPKVKELRIKADESARTIQVYIREGLEAPVSLPRHFEYLLLSIAKLYQGNILKNTYVLDYWSPIEINPDQSYSYHAPPRAVSLFKFVRFAGDMLPSTLFVPYVTFLSSLSTCQQAARNCFNMLKQVGLLLSSTISWDHFFMSFGQYYSNLREETPAIADTIYGHKGFHRAVSPLEIRGLQSVLLLIRTVAEHDEFSRLALCEHPGWAPLTVLLGLIGCSIPIPLKAELISTLATLSKSPENASQMWENLEASQILVTIPSISGYTPRGIQTELEEVESRDEEYPLTKAFLKLLDSLTDLGIPRMLGAGPRKPGFTPYLTFIVNSVFLRYHTRSYKDPSEKWEVAHLCLQLFEKFLKHYDPQVLDVSMDDTTKEFHTPPGFHLMVQFNNKTDLLNLILDIVHDGCAMFDQYVSFPGEDMLQKCILHCLNIIHRVLVLQSSFASIVAASTEPILMTGIMKLLLTINRKSGKPDHCVNIAKYVNCQYHLPKHANSAIKVLQLVLASPVAHSHFVSMLFSMEDVAKDIKFGFIECLDEIITEENERLCLSTKLEILKLLKQCVVFNAPNLAHYLLGFDIKQDISKSNLFLPGVNESPRSCLHSIFVLFNLAIRDSIPYQLLEATYHMLHILCSNAKTSGPVLRFVKSNENFFINHLKYCYKHLNDMQSLRQASWLLKTVAIELKVCSASKQVKYLKQLANFLTGYPSYDIGVCNDTFALISKPTLSDAGPTFAPISFDEPDFFMLNLTEHFESKEVEPEMPTWDIFNKAVLENILKCCQTETNPKLMNIKKLHKILNDELRGLQGTAIIGQIQAINQEIPKVLKFALEVNKSREKSTAIIQFVEAWCQVIDVIVIYIPYDIMSPSDKQYLCIQLLVKLLKTVTQVEILSDASKLLSATILLLLKTLQNCHLQEKKINKMSPTPKKDLYVIQANADTLKEILRLLMKWIIASNIVSEKLRINVYACLMVFLELTHVDLENEGIFLPQSSFVSRLDSSKLNLNHIDCTTITMPTDVISDFGERLVEILCHDSISAHDMCKVLAMTTLGQLIFLTGNMNWIAYMSGRGYLKHIIQSIFESDKDLLNLLEPTANNFKVLYVYSAKISFLIKLAGNRMGAELLLEHNLLSCLSNMKVFGHHPEINKTWDYKENISQFTPSLEEQYLQIWLPTFDICNALLTTLGCDNKSALVQIIYYILSHLDVVELILRCGCPELSTISFKELALVTFVLARTANNELINILNNPELVQNNRAQLYRLQKLIFALLPKFILSDSVIRGLIHNISNNMLNTYQTSQRLLYGMQVICNLLSYCRSIVANHGIDHAGVGVIFEPNLNITSTTQSAYEQVPTLGVIVQHLISAVNYHHQEKVTLDRLHRKIKEIPEMSSMDLREFVDESLKLQNLGSVREQIFDFTTEKMNSKEREIKYCAFIIEHALYLIWVHLDYYMLKAIPRGKHFGPVTAGTVGNLNESLASATEATWKVSTDDISNLKQGLVSIFNDSFTKQLLETLHDLPESDKGLAEALLRKIKRLIQFVPVK